MLLILAHASIDIMFEQLKVRLFSVLRWSEQYTKTNMVYLAKGGLWLFLGQVVIASSGLILAVAFANLVPKEVYGTYQFIMAGSVIVSAFTLIGMSTAVSRAIARGRDGALRAGFRAQLLWSPGVVLAGAALATYYYLNGNQVLAASFLIVGALSPLLSSFGLSQAYFTGKQLFKESVMFGLWRRLFPVGAVLTTILLTHDPVILIFAYFASNTLSAALLYWLVVTRYKLPETADEETVSYGKHLSILKIISEIMSQADKVLIWVFLGAAPVAAYTLALLPIKQIEGVLKLVYPLTFAKLANNDFSTLKKTLSHKVRIFLLVAGCIALAYAVVAPFLFKTLFPMYPESILLSQILVLSILSKPRTLYSQAFAAHHRRRPQYIINLTSNALKIVLLLTLLPLYGIWGAVYALLGTQLYVNLLTRYLFAKAS